MNDTWRRLLPAVGLLIGVLGAAVYWMASELWPTNVAVILSMLTVTLATESLARDSPAKPSIASSAPYWVFAIFIKYDALMALTAAKLPFAAPAFLALGLIIIAAQAASHALALSIADATVRPISNTDLLVSGAIGLIPSLPLGIPGLVGLAAAIAARLVSPSFAWCRRIAQQVTEVCFILGALASWKYI